METLVSILLPTAVGTANSCAPQSATLRLIKTQKNPAEKTSAGFYYAISASVLRDLTPRERTDPAGASGERNAW